MDLNRKNKYQTGECGAFVAFLLLFIMSLPLQAQEKVDSFDNCSEGASGFINVYDSTKSIPAIYCSASGFSDGLAAVKKGGRWGYIDADNNVVLDFQFDYARSFKQDRAVVKVGEFYGVINKLGEFVIPPRYYDLMSYELENNRYYISRDSTFFQGVIDSVGREILPHQYTYIITYQPNLSQQRFYKNIPFYTVYQAIDSTKGSFYEQFKEDSYQFSPEKGRHDIYDLKFDKLASRNSTNYRDGFPHKQLVRVDSFLAENTDLVATEKVKEIANVLSSPAPDTLEAVDSNIESFQYGVGVMNHDEIEDHLAGLGYQLFTNKEGEIGLKKGTSIVIPAENTFFRLLNNAFRAPMKADIPYLQENYAGAYRSQENGVFDLFFIAAGDSKKGRVYTLSGKRVLTLENMKKALTDVTKVGFKYINSVEGSSSQYGLVNWKGEVILPPVYKEIEVLNTGQLIVKQENKDKEGIEEYMGLYTETGDVVIPLGIYSEIKPFQKTDNLYLATQSTPHSTVEAEALEPENKDYVILKVTDNAYIETNKFSGSMIFTWALDMETGLMPYHQKHSK